MADYGYVQHQRSLTALAVAITRNSEDARDVVQDVFAECVRRKLDPDREYLFRSVRNRSLNVIRSRNRLDRMLARFRDFAQRAEDFLTPAQDSGIIDSVLKLPTHYKEVVILRIHSELSVGEVASILGIPEGTVKSRLNSALKILRKRLEVNT